MPGLLRGLGEREPFVLLDLDRVHAVVPAVDDHLAIDKLLEERGDRHIPRDVRKRAVPADELVAFARGRPRGFRRFAVGYLNSREDGASVHERDRVQDLRRVVESRVGRGPLHRVDCGRPAGERVVVGDSACAGRDFRDAGRRAVEIGGGLQLRAVEVEEADRVGAERLRIDRVVVKILGGGGGFHVPALECVAVLRSGGFHRRSAVTRRLAILHVLRIEQSRVGIEEPDGEVDVGRVDIDRVHSLILRKNSRRLDFHAVVCVPAAEHLAIGRLGIRRERDPSLVVRVAVGRRAAVVEDHLVDRQMERVREYRVADAVAAPDAAVRSRAVRGVENPGETVALHVGRVHPRVRGDGGKPGQHVGIVVAVGNRAGIGTDNPVRDTVCYAEAVEYLGSFHIFANYPSRISSASYTTQVSTISDGSNIFTSNATSEIKT